MAYDPGAIDAALTAALGDQPALIVELRQAFDESARAALVALEHARSDDAWSAAAWRLKGLAASFGALRLMAVATEATLAGRGDPALVRRIRRAIDRL